MIMLGGGEASLRALWLSCGGTAEDFAFMKTAAFAKQKLSQAEVCKLIYNMLVRGYPPNKICQGLEDGHNCIGTQG